MDKISIEYQKTLASQSLERLEEKEGQKARAITIVFEFLSSLLEPDKFTDAQKEDLRKLALELGFQENSSFEEWEKLSQS